MKILSDEEFIVLCEEKGLEPYEMWHNFGQAIALNLPVVWGTKEEIGRVVLDPFGKNKKEGDTAPYYIVQDFN